MSYVRAGTISAQPGLLTRVMDFPYRLYQALMFFVMTLIDVRIWRQIFFSAHPFFFDERSAPRAQPNAAKKASQMARGSGKAVKRPVSGMRNLGQGGGCGPVGG